MWGRKEIDAAQWKAARQPIEARINNNKRRLAKANDNYALHDVIGRGSQLRAEWPDLSLSRKAAIVQAVLSHAAIKAGTPGARTLDPARVEPFWRV